jgi:protein phosphatase
MHEHSKETAVHVPHDVSTDEFFATSYTAIPFVFGAGTHVGHVRRQNEDHFAVFRWRRSTEVLITSVMEGLDVPSTCSYAMVVADGMGGMKSGEVASRLALQTMAELAGHATSWIMKLNDLDAQRITQRVRAYVERIHATIQAQGESDPALHNMGTTWTSAHLLGDHAVVVHLGDSRAYLARDGRLHRITHDETMAQTLIDSGMDPDSVRRFRHVLLNSFGGGNDSARATIHHLQLEPADKLLLCTDGLTDLVSDGEIAGELSRHSTPQAACDALIKEALQRGGKDNVTVVLAAAERTGPVCE